MAEINRDGQLVYDCNDCTDYGGYVGDHRWQFESDDPGSVTSRRRYCPECGGGVRLSVSQNGRRARTFFLHEAGPDELALISGGANLFAASERSS